MACLFVLVFSGSLLPEYTIQNYDILITLRMEMIYYCRSSNTLQRPVLAVLSCAFHGLFEMIQENEGFPHFLIMQSVSPWNSLCFDTLTSC